MGISFLIRRASTRIRKDAVEFALDFTPEAIILHERNREGMWQVFARTDTKDAELPIILGLLSAEAAAYAGGRRPVRLWLPSDQIMTLHARIDGDTPASRVRAAFDHVDQHSPHRANDVAIAVSPAGKDGMSTILATFAATWLEARDYAQRWGFVPGAVSTRGYDGAFGERGPEFRLNSQIEEPAPPNRRRLAAMAAVALLAVGTAAWQLVPWQDHEGAPQTTVTESAPTETTLTAAAPEEPAAPVPADAPADAPADIPDADQLAAATAPDPAPLPALPEPPATDGLPLIGDPLASAESGPPFVETLASLAAPAAQLATPSAPPSAEPPSAEPPDPAPDLVAAWKGPVPEMAPLEPILPSPSPADVIPVEQRIAVDHITMIAGLEPGIVSVDALSDVSRPGAPRIAAPPQVIAAVTPATDAPITDATPTNSPPAAQPGPGVASPDAPQALAPAADLPTAGTTVVRLAEISSLVPFPVPRPGTTAGTTAATTDSAETLAMVIPPPRPLRSGRSKSTRPHTLSAPPVTPGEITDTRPEGRELVDTPRVGSIEPLLDPLADKPGAKPDPNAPTRFASMTSPMPETRPDVSDDHPEPEPVAVSLPLIANPGQRSVLSAATSRGLPLDSTSLIGILDLESGRKALLRLPDGRYRSVVVGDVLDGWRVNMIGVDAMRVTRGAEDRTLLLVSR